MHREILLGERQFLCDALPAVQPVEMSLVVDRTSRINLSFSQVACGRRRPDMWRRCRSQVFPAYPGPERVAASGAGLISLCLWPYELWLCVLSAAFYPVMLNRWRNYLHD